VRSFYTIMTKENTDSNENSQEINSSLETLIQEQTTDLLYPSESDEPITYVSCYFTQEEQLTVSQIKDWLMLPPSIYVEEVDENWFWEPVIAEQDWYGEEEKKRTAKFQQLKKLLEENLNIRQAFRVGDTEVDVYLLGRLSDGSGRAGIKTKVVET
jgi:hypothetical protein